MSLKSFLARPFSGIIATQVDRWKSNPVSCQNRIFRHLISKAQHTQFGQEHGFSKISSYADFKSAVPIRDYEHLRPYIDRIIAGEQDVLWTGKPLYFAKTSGTTSGVKYIPISADSIPYHINTARNALLLHIAEKGRADFVDGKMIFLSGSPEMDRVGGILTGRLSGIVNHHVPAYLRANQLPSYATNCIDDWEAKLDKIIEETIRQNMTLISGIPPWVQMYFDRLMERTGKAVGDVFPNLSLLVHGGVNFEPYKAKINNSLGRKVDTIETYPASEGFIAFQDSIHEEGLLLNVAAGMFFEFIPAVEIFTDNPIRLSLQEVEIGVNYAIILNTNAGFWGYNIGDTVKFVSKYPFRIVVTGRIKHFISAFGEHVIQEEVEAALMQVVQKTGVEVVEFTVAPQIHTTDELPYHEWLIEFSEPPADLKKIALEVDRELCKKNIYYSDLIEGKILQPLQIRIIEKDGFRNYMKTKGKLGGQNKVPRLSNDRVIADELCNFRLKMTVD